MLFQHKYHTSAQADLRAAPTIAASATMLASNDERSRPTHSWLAADPRTGGRRTGNIKSSPTISVNNQRRRHRSQGTLEPRNFARITQDDTSRPRRLVHQGDSDGRLGRTLIDTSSRGPPNVGSCRCTVPHAGSNDETSGAVHVDEQQIKTSPTE